MTISKDVQHMADAAAQDMQTYLTGLIQEAMRRYLAQEGLTIAVEQLPIVLGFSAQASFGDYSMPVMPWSGKNKLGRPPMAIAEALATLLREAHNPVIAEVTVTKPGFLNFRLDQPAIGRAIIEQVLTQGAEFGQSTSGQGTKVIVEHTAINSNKAAHVGHLRNSCIGDTVVRMLRSQGYDVEAQNYIDDSGVQVADVVVGFTLMQQGKLQVPGGNEPQTGESFDYFCSRVYVAVGRQYEEHPELLELRKTILHAIEHGDEPASGPDFPTLASDLSHQIVQAHLKTMARLNITYNLLTWESAVLAAGLWTHTFAMLRQRGLLEKPESGPAAGCWILPFGDESNTEQPVNENERMQDKILVRSDGTATYTAKDIAQHIWKFGLSDDPAIDVQFHYIPWGTQHDGQMLWSMRAPTDTTAASQEGDPKRFGHAKRAINVIDIRQSYPQQVVRESLRRLGYEDQATNLTHIGYEVVTLSRSTAAGLGIDTSDGRNFYPMSGRKGIEIKADDLINAAVANMLARMAETGTIREQNDETAAILASSAIRYFMIRFGLQQVIALDMDEALRPNGDTGVYLQYAYARASKILRRLQGAGYTVPERLENLPEELKQSEWELLRHIDAYPRRLAETTAQLAPNTLAAYAFDLASHFSDFYEHTDPVLHEGNADIKAFRTHLVRATVQTMGNVLRVLGFVPLEEI
ncbi:MAG TPA: arginine--tRNA ligase [Ktedonobacteraceae bacterium]|nr:arginine--tRNA ligase [Ktedonobacteraceae bacterium]